MSGYKHAFSLTKVEVLEATPPGTVKLISHDLERTLSGYHEEKHDHIVLSPLPSADPADPLNWPSWRKNAVLLCMSIFAFLSNFTSAGISSALPVMIMAFPQEGPKSFGRLTHLISVNVLFLGVSNIWWVPLANVFGRRPVVLFSLLALACFSIWAAKATTFTSLLAARAFMGMTAGSAETVAPDIVGEIFFVHQRGRSMAIYTMLLALGAPIGGIAGGYIAAARGWRSVNWVNAILAAALFVMCFFLQPETLFHRNTSQSNNLTTDSTSSHRKDKVAVQHLENANAYDPFKYRRSLKIGTYRGGIVRQFIAPFKTLRLPGVWMVMLQYAGLVAGVVTVSIIATQITSSPPYLWGKNAGLVNIGAIIGTLLGALYTYVVADRAIKSDAKRETHGLAEPESRLKTQFPGLAMATFGLWIFGACAANSGPNRWIGLEFGYGMLAFGLMQAPSIGFNYLIESYNTVSGDCLVMVVLMRAIVSFAWTFFAGDWVHDRGPMEPFGIFGMLMAIFTLLTVPLYIWGKRTRIATSRWLPEKSDH